MFVNVLVYWHQFTLGTGRAGLVFVYQHGFVPARFAAEPLAAAGTLVTHAFLHASVLHLLGNMVFLIVFGDNIEDRMGHGRFLVFYLLGAVLAAAAQGLLAGDPRTPLIGASGAISAVLGAYLRIFPSQRVQAFIPILILPWLVLRFFSRQPKWFAPWLPAWVFLGYWALVQVSEALGPEFGAEGGVAWWAHLGGFAFGVLVAKTFARQERRANETYFG